MKDKRYWFFGSKLNTVLLLILIVLMVIALRFMYTHPTTYPGVEGNRFTVSAS